MRVPARATGVTLILALCCTGALAVPITAGMYNGGGIISTWGTATGYQFTPSVDMIVSALGVYDLGQPGFASPHNVGIFEMDGTVVATASLGAGTSGTLIDGTRFVPIPLVTLAGGTEYYALADNFSVDTFVYGSGGAVTYAAEITWNGYTHAVGNSIFASPLHYGGVPGNLGPNFRYEVGVIPEVIPEPATISLLALGGLALTRRRRRR